MLSYYSIFLNLASSTIMVMEEFHDYTMVFLTIIISFIMTIIVKIMTSKFTNYKFKENMNLEIIWTILPMIILLMIAYPSLYYLYLFDLTLNPSETTKVFGIQWFWAYEYSDSKEPVFYSSYMTDDLTMLTKKMNMGWRLLETSSRLIVPYMTEIQCVGTSMDVIHSFSIPDLGIKMDVVPGRLNTINFKIQKPGIFYGQCAEICGTGHSFMPICMEASF